MAASLCRVFLMGNLTRDVELRHTPKGTPVAEIALGINRTWSDEEGRKREEAVFVDVTLWSRTAEIAQQYLRKGSPVFIEGRLQLDTWEDKQSGQKRSRLRVIGETMQLLSGKSSGSGAPASPPHEPVRRAPAPPRPPQGHPQSVLEPDLDVDESF